MEKRNHKLNSMEAGNSKAPFYVKDCATIACMGGIEPAMNLRELRERIAACPIECIFHHFCEPALRSTFDDPEFRNDFAVWAARQLRDRALAERLGALNPYSFDDFEQLRHEVLDIIDDRLSELTMIPWAPRGSEFRFMKALTVVFESDLILEKPQDLIRAVPNMTNSAIYFHFVESHRRPPIHVDDFSAWLTGFGAETQEMIRALQQIDFYFLTLTELKQEIIKALNRFKRSGKNVA